MRTLNRSETLTLLIGDVAVFFAALVAALSVRTGEAPSGALLEPHFVPFTILFIVWVGVFFVSGLYENHTTVLKSRLPAMLLNAQLINAALAITFFYLIPAFGITPKTILFIHLFVSFVLIIGWRLYVFPFVQRGKREHAIVIGHGPELHELVEEVNANSRYQLFFSDVIDFDDCSAQEAQDKIAGHSDSCRIVVADLEDHRIAPLLPTFNLLLFSNVRFFEFYDLYESIFGRVPLAELDYRWGIGQTASLSQAAYDAAKRTMDIVIAGVGAVVSLLLYPAVIAAIKLDDGGPIFVRQQRLGHHGKKIIIAKFRTMKGSDRGKWVSEGDNRITRAGKFLRITRIDELPQLWSVLKGDLSLIGPRPDVVALGEQLQRDIPHYLTRYLIKPGLSGWAQIKQELPPQSLEETKTRLSYDLYYLKHRSFWLDLKIALQTIKTLLSRTGK